MQKHSNPTCVLNPMGDVDESKEKVTPLDLVVNAKISIGHSVTLCPAKPSLAQSSSASCPDKYSRAAMGISAQPRYIVFYGSFIKMTATCNSEEIGGAHVNVIIGER